MREVLQTGNQKTLETTAKSDISASALFFALPTAYDLLALSLLCAWCVGACGLRIARGGRGAGCLGAGWTS